LFVLPDGLPLELTPLAFLVGKWQGSGVISYKADDQDSPAEQHEFFQTVEFADNGLNALSYSSIVRLADGSDASLPSELGFWKIARPHEPADHGPGLLLGVGEPSIKTHEDLDRLRTDQGFALEVSTLHPGGVAELYHGFVKNARIDLASASGAAFETAKTYRHSTRLYGLVEGALLWAWDIALPGSELKPHASARLERIG
jgi:THAP4-like, heme-binding beta-barrel domain